MSDPLPPSAALPLVEPVQVMRPWTIGDQRV